MPTSYIFMSVIYFGINIDLYESLLNLIIVYILSEVIAWTLIFFR